MLKVAVVVTTYNQEKYIKTALDSIVNQKTNFKFELVVSDDCSTDNTANILIEYAQKYPSIIRPIFNKTNMGAMNNYICTLASIKAKYVAICDGDDFWTNNYKLQKQVDFLDANEDFAICFHQTEIFFEDNSRPVEISPQNIKSETSLKDLLLGNYIPANAVMYRWAFNEVNFAQIFPQNIVPGDYFTHLLHAQKGKIKFFNEVLSSYRRHANGFWWVTADVNEDTNFMLRYGIQYLNFLQEVEKTFAFNSNINSNTKSYIMDRLLKLFLQNKNFNLLANLSKTYTALYKSAVNSIYSDHSCKEVHVTELYASLPRYKKLLFLIIIDKNLLLNKIKSKIKKKLKEIWT